MTLFLAALPACRPSDCNAHARRAASRSRACSPATRARSGSRL